jgi:RNA polymerase sigma factor (sigma-70 family)
MEASALRAGTFSGTRRGALRRVAGDDKLVTLVRAGRADAFEAIYDRYHRQILSFCRHMLGSREEAEDAVQHTFMAAYTDLRRSDKRVQLRPWLYTIARNHCMSLLRARREQAPLDDAEPSVDGLAATVQRREDLRDLLRDLARLPDEQRAALVLAELGALSHDEIAEVVGCPKGKVKALVFQARSSLGARREAREIPCQEIQEQLATLKGGSLRRTALRRHLDDCPGCRAFQAEVKRQRAAMAVLLPVAPTVALKSGVLSAVALKAGGAGGLGGAGLAAGAGAGAGGAATATGGGGLGALLAQAGVVKLVVAGAVAAAGVGGTVVAVDKIESARTTKSSPTVHPSGQDASGVRAPFGATPSGVTPTRAGGEHAPGRQSGGVANGKNAKGAHGRSGTAPGKAGTSPGKAGTAPGKAGTTPGKSGTAPGQAKTKSGYGRGGSGALRRNNSSRTIGRSPPTYGGGAGRYGSSGQGSAGGTSGLQGNSGTTGAGGDSGVVHGGGGALGQAESVLAGE